MTLNRRRRIVAIDWDSQELRTAVGEVGRNELLEVHCTAQPWDAAEQQGLEAGSLAAAELLLAELDLSRARGLLLARRQDLETFRWSAPPADDGELAELVENYLASDMGLGADDAVYDYWTLDGESGDSRQVAITAMQNETADAYSELAAKLRLRKPRLSVRACGAAALVASLLPENDQPTLAIVPNSEEVDIVMVQGGRLGFWRSAYCSPTGDSAAFHSFLTAEVTRTLAVAEESLADGEQINSVALFLGKNEDGSLAAALERSLDLPVVRLGVTPENVATTYGPADSPPGRFAPLIGALHQEAEGRRPPVDLLNRPVRPKPENTRRPLVLAALGVVTAVGLGGYVLREDIVEAQAEAGRLSAQLDKVEEQIEQVEPDAETWQAIAAWDRSNIVWLDELRDLSLRFPPPGSTVVLDFSASPNRSGGAAIRISGKARDPGVVTTLDSRLRDDQRSALSRNLREQNTSPDDPFQWRFESSLVAGRRSPEEYQTGGEVAAPAQQHPQEAP